MLAFFVVAGFETGETRVAPYYTARTRFRMLLSGAIKSLAFQYTVFRKMEEEQRRVHDADDVTVSAWT
jgi:hypothetical protein